MREESGIRIISTIIVMLLLLGAFFIVASDTVSAGQYHYGDYDYTTDGSPTVVTIKSYTGTGGSITIPSTLGGFPVVAIGDYAFSSKQVTSVTIGSSIASIGWGAFYSATSLTSVTIIGNGHTSIGTQAFYQCLSLNSISIGNGVTSIGDNAFQLDRSLTSMILPSSLASIGYAVFDRCTALTSLTFLGLNAPSIGSGWIDGTPGGLRGHAYSSSNFPAPGTSDFYGLTMGAVIPMPSAPTSLLASPGYGVVTLSWAAPNANVFIPITSYNVYRAVDNVSGSYSLIASSSKLNYTDSGLASGPIYFYKVSAIIAAGESVQSLPASAHVTQSPIATTDNTTLILIVCGIVIALALIIGVILAKTSKRTRQRDKFVKPIYVAALGRCPICGKAVLTDMKHCANCGWTVDANLLLPLTKK